MFYTSETIRESLIVLKDSSNTPLTISGIVYLFPCFNAREFTLGFFVHENSSSAAMCTVYEVVSSGIETP